MTGKILSFILIAAVLGTIGSLVYVAAVPRETVPFTEFYILGSQDKAADYPDNLKAGENGNVKVTIVNREHEAITYAVGVTVAGKTINQVGPMLLEDGQKWEGEISFSLNNPGTRQKVEFLLYKNGESQPYLGPLILWVNVN